MSPDAMLHWRDHHALQTVVHVIVESALARISDDAVAGVLDEIRQAVSEALDSHDFVKAGMRPTTPSGCPELLSAAVQSPANLETDASAPEPPRRESWVEVPTARSAESSKVSFALATPSASPEVPRRGLDLSPESPPSAPSPSASPSRSLAERLETPPVSKQSLLARLYDSPAPARSINDLSRETLRSIFSYLLPPPTSVLSSYSGGRFFDLIQASHVCQLWRQLIKKMPPLWSMLCGLCPSEYRHLVNIIARTNDAPLHLRIDLRSYPSCSIRAISLTAQRHMSHIRQLEIFLGSGQGKEWDTFLSALEIKAPLLESCTLFFPRAKWLPSSLFKRKAPRLKTFKAHIGLLPDSCPAFRNVESFQALYDTRHPTFGELARIDSLFPALTSLVLDLTPIEVGSAPGGLLPHLRSLQVTDSSSRRGASAVLPTLNILQYSRFRTLKVVTASEATLLALRTAMSNNQHLYIFHISDSSGQSRAQIAIQGDTDLCISFLSSPMIWVDAVLQHHTMLGGLTRLNLGMTMRAADWEKLFAATLPQLHSLTMYVCADTASVDATPLVGLLDYPSSSTSKWHLPVLRHMIICAREPRLDLEPIGRPTVSAASLTRFIVDMSGHESAHGLELTLDGVAIEEPLFGPETALAGLRCILGGLTYRNYPC